MGFLHDVRYAARVLRRAPGFTALAAGVLALGIGANGAIFSLLDAALLRPLPFAQPDRLLMLWERSPLSSHNRVAPLNFLDWSEQQQTFAAVAAVAGSSRTIAGASGTAEWIPGQAVTSRFFDVLGVPPLAGRTFTAADAAGRANVVVISERLWRSRLGGDPSAIGQTLVIDSEPFTVVGVMPSTFEILWSADVWGLFLPRRSPEQRRQHYLQVIGRLKPGVTEAQAAADMAAIAGRIAVEAPDSNKGWGVTLAPLREGIVGTDLRQTTLLLSSVVAFVMLMACANVANLLLARGIGRTREIAVRAAIGGSRGRIVRQLLVESVVLAGVGGAAGLALSWIAIRVAPALLPPDTLPPAIVLQFDTRVALAGFGLTLATAMICGLFPAAQALNTPLAQVLASSGRGATRSTGALRSALVAGEIGAAMLLLTGAGLLGRTLSALNAVDPGYRADRVLTATVSLPFNRYAGEGRMARFYEDAGRELASIPGVALAAFGGMMPYGGMNIGQGYQIVGAPPADAANLPIAHYQIVSGSYFKAMGIELVHGRAFADRDGASAPAVCVVNETFVRKHLQGRDPIGTRVSVQSMTLRGGPTPVVREIVGVSRSVTVESGEKEPPVEIYVPIAQNPWFWSSIVLQTAGDPAAFAPAMKAAVAKVDPGLALTRVHTMSELAAEATAQPRFRARLVGIFAVVAVTLAAVGLFGVLTYAVSQRAREFGIRVALGATSADVLRLVMGSAFRMTAAGIAVGLAAAAGLTRFLATLLFGVTPLDPVTFTSTAALLAGVAFAACATPAWRAARVDPASTLRQE